MCLIIHKPATGYVDMQTIQSAREYNPDGVGFMDANHVEKWESIKSRKLYDRINSAENAAVHFRMATHGKVNAANIHPFRLADDGYLMHNGILSKYAPTKGLVSAKSDTALFCELFCNPIIQETGKLSLRAVDTEIGSNAVAIMNNRKRITRLGHGWNEYNGSWYSNQYAWDCPTRYIATNYDNWYDVENGYGYEDVAEDMNDLTDAYLYSFADTLPLETDQYIAVSDQGAYDDLWLDGNTETFLDTIGPESKLKLMAYLIERGYITP